MIILTILNTSLIVVILVYLFKIHSIDQKYNKSLISWLKAQEQINLDQLALIQLTNQKIKALQDE